MANRISKRPHHLIVCISICITLIAGTAAALPLRGIVADSAGTPVGNAMIQLYDPLNSVLMYSTQADAAGHFEFADIGEMEYQIHLGGLSFPEQWFSFTGNTMYKQYRIRIGVASTFDTLFVTMVNNPINNPPNNTLIVNLTDSTGGTLGYGSGMSVSLIRNFDGIEIQNSYVMTGSSVTFDTLQAAEYAILVRGGTYPSQFYHPVRNTELPAFYLPVAGGTTRTITVKLCDPPAGTALLNGQVTSETNQPLTGIAISLCMPYDTFKTVYTQTTDTNGRFSFSNIRDMDYYLRLSGGGFPVQWFSKSRNATTLFADDYLWPGHFAGDTVLIRCSSTPLNNPPVGMIRLTVNDSANSVIKTPGSVTLVSVKDNTVFTPGFDSVSQLYLAENLPSGMYFVKLVFPPYPVQYYSPSGNSTAPMYQIMVSPNTTLLYTVMLNSKPGQTTYANMPGVIRGVVRDSAGPLGGASISLYNRNGMFIQSMTTTNDGMFSPMTIPSQELYVMVSHPLYQPQFWSPGKMTTVLSDSNYFVLTPYDTLSIDALLSNRTAGTVTQPQHQVTITGKVTDANTGNRISGVRIVLFDWDASTMMNYRYLTSPWTDTTDTNGSFTISLPMTGTFRCMAIADTLGYITQFYPKSDLYAGAKVFVIDSTGGTFTLDFSLRKGATLLGKVTDAVGAPLPDVRISCSSSSNTQYFETMSLAGGNWKITGIPAGTWNVWAANERYIVTNDTIKRVYPLSEGQSLTVPNFTMERGGFVSGTFSTPQSLYDTSSGQGMQYGELSCFSVIKNNPNGLLLPAFSSGIMFQPNAANGMTGTFNSQGIRTGVFELLYSPQPRYPASTTTTASRTLLPGFGYSFINSTGVPSKFTIVAGDTVKGGSLVLRKGFSIFGTMKSEAGTPLAGGYGIDVFVKRDSVLYHIAHTSSLPNGGFEIPGLVDNEDYYFQLWAEFYPQQFWSPESTTVLPSKPFHFSASTYVPLQCTILKVIKESGNGSGAMQGPLALTIAGDSAGCPLLTWQTGQGLSLDTFTLFSIDRTGTVNQIVKFSGLTEPTAYSYRHTTTSGKYREYVLTGKSAATVVRSNRIAFDPRQSSGIPLWFDVYKNHAGIGLEWGSGKNVVFTEKDSVSVFRRTGTETPKLLFKSNAWNSMSEDHAWSRSDSGKTFTYSIEITSKGLTAAPVSFTLDAAFYAQLPKTLVVGPYERYQRITDAIAAAADGDQIEIQSGTYAENISFSGKNISLYGRWDFGKPPTIDGSGSAAILVPFCKSVTGWNRPRISGCAIKNCATGIKSSSPVDIEGCLFDNVTVAISMAIDSAAMTPWMQSYPFAQPTLDAYVKNCTFIAKKPGSMVATVTAAGKAEQPGYTDSYSGKSGYYVQPVLSLSSSVWIDRAIVAFYQSSGLQSVLPVTIQGNSGMVKFARSDFWKTSVALQFTNSMVDSLCSFTDPLFTDSTTWFLNDASTLAGKTYDTRFGYDVRTLNGYGSSTNSQQPAALKNIVSRTVGLTTVLVTWTPSPAADSVVRYRVYRAPGDPSRYFIDQNAQWELKVSQDSMFSVVDTFSTDKNGFLDTTAKQGVPYLYVVAGINGKGDEGEIRLPAPPDIASYFVNKPNNKITLAANRWQMIGIVGSDNITIGAESMQPLFGWNDKNPSDKLYAQYFQGNQMTIANGYWIKPSTDTTLSAAASSLGGLLLIEKTASITLSKGTTGWNLVSSPFPFETKPSWLATFDAWEWSADSTGYRKTTVLRPWKAYWIYTSKDTTLPLWKKRNLADYLTAPLAKSQAAAVAWELRLSLQTGNSHDVDNIIGVLHPGHAGSETYDSREPPAPFDGARLSILCKKTASASPEKFAEHFIDMPSNDKRLEWLISIGASTQQSVMRIDGIGDVPKKYQLFWIEKDRIINVRQQQNVSFAARNIDHNGLIVATTNVADLALYTGKLQLRSPLPNSLRGTATIEYTLPYAWQNSGAALSGSGIPVRLELFDITGRVVATIVNGIQEPGVYRMVWSGKNRAGSVTVPGMYIMKLSYGGNQVFARFCRVQ